MATKPNTSPTGQGPQHFLAPSARELRAQSVHRLQIGLLGLAVMLLIVGLANIIMDRARLTEADITGNRTTVSDAKKADSDPLAVIGAVPSPEASAPASTSPAR